MKGKIMGVRVVPPFTDQKTGEVVEGTKLFVAAEDLDTFGKASYEIWVQAGSALEQKLAKLFKEPSMLVGVGVEFSYKPKSKKLAQFEVLEAAK